MATESPVLGQLRHIPSSSSVISLCSAVEPHPPASDPLQGLVHEMALSAVIQKHGSNVSSTANSPYPSSNGTIIKSYFVPAQASSTSIVTPSSTDQFATSCAVSVPPSLPPLAPQGANVVLSGAAGNMHQGFFLSAGTPQSLPGGGVSLLAHPSHSQSSPVLQGTSMSQFAGHLQEVSSAAANMVHLAPVCSASGQVSPVMERSAFIQPSLVG